MSPIDRSEALVDLEQQQIRKRGLSTLDLRGENGFTADIAVDEKVCIGEQRRQRIEPADSLVRSLQLELERAEVERWIGRERLWDERADALATDARRQIGTFTRHRSGRY